MNRILWFDSIFEIFLKRTDFSIFSTDLYEIRNFFFTYSACQINKSVFVLCQNISVFIINITRIAKTGISSLFYTFYLKVCSAHISTEFRVACITD